MYPFKVIYLESSFIKKSGNWAVQIQGHIDGITTSRELKALLIEEEAAGFDLVSITPINSNIAGPMQTYPMTVTSGFMVTFKKRAET